jgi:hypothetical protein
VKRQVPAKNNGEISSLYARSSSRTAAATLRAAGAPARVLASIEEGEVVSFKGAEGCIQPFPPGHDDDVECVRNLVPPEQLARDSLRAITLDRRSQLARGGDTEAWPAEIIGDNEERHEAALDANTCVVGPLELGTATNPLGGSESVPGHRYPSSLTVSRLRPLARRRFSTIRPFLVAMRTRNPWVFARRRVFGWKVRLPFFDLAMVSYTKD